MTGPANQEAFEAWNGESGRRWVLDPDRPLTVTISDHHRQPNLRQTPPSVNIEAHGPPGTRVDTPTIRSEGNMP